MAARTGFYARACQTVLFLYTDVCFGFGFRPHLGRAIG